MIFSKLMSLRSKILTMTESLLKRKWFQHRAFGKNVSVPPINLQMHPDPWRPIFILLFIFILDPTEIPTSRLLTSPTQPHDNLSEHIKLDGVRNAPPG